MEATSRMVLRLQVNVREQPSKNVARWMEAKPDSMQKNTRRRFCLRVSFSAVPVLTFPIGPLRDPQTGQTQANERTSGRFGRGLWRKVQTAEGLR